MIIKRILITSLFCLLTFTTNAQEWLTNFEEAKKQSAESNKNIVLVFQGSDWCAPCMKLDKDVWSTKAFRDYAKDHFILLEADFPKKRKNKLSEEQEKHNGMLFEKYNTIGAVPYVVVLDSEGNVLGTSGYKSIPVEEYIKELASF